MVKRTDARCRAGDDSRIEARDESLRWLLTGDIRPLGRAIGRPVSVEPPATSVMDRAAGASVGKVLLLINVPQGSPATWSSPVRKCFSGEPAKVRSGTLFAGALFARRDLLLPVRRISGLAVVFSVWTTGAGMLCSIPTKPGMVAFWPIIRLGSTTSLAVMMANGSPSCRYWFIVKFPACCG